jgi:hypothetical protein
MEENELRIGNYIKRKQSGTIVETKQFMLHDYELKYFEPIPLTEEWLLKFGFKKSIVKEPWFERNKIELFKYSKGDFFLLGRYNTAYGIGLHDIWDGMEINLQYVHQLQNLYFALTAEELTIKPNE